MPHHTDQGARWRERLAAAQVMLVYTPEVLDDRDPWSALDELLPVVDVIQVRPKPIGPSQAPAPARTTLDCARAILSRVQGMESGPLVLVDDRVDVARILGAEGLAGVHLGRADMNPIDAREFLGPEPLIGLSTHSLQQVLRASETPVDYIGLGPVFPTLTKEKVQGAQTVFVGPERAWLAHEASPIPVFPIGGINPLNALELSQVGRAAVASALLCSPRPRQEAEHLRAALTPTDGQTSY